MLVTSRSDRHIEQRHHAYTVSGASPTLAHSSSLNAVNQLRKEREAKEAKEKEQKRANDDDTISSLDREAQVAKNVGYSFDEVETYNSESSLKNSNSNLNNNNNNNGEDDNTNLNNSNGSDSDKENKDNNFKHNDKNNTSLNNNNNNNNQSKDDNDKENKENNSNNNNNNNNKNNNNNGEWKETKESSGTFNFLAFRKVFTTRELMSNKKPPQRPVLMRQKSYFLEEHMSFKDSTLKATDLTSLQKILYDRVGFVTFKNFLKSVFADENLQFWKDVNSFKESEPDQKLYEARKIYVLYIHEKASYPLNVASTTKSAIQAKIESPDYVIQDKIFEEAQMEAYDMLERDLFPRFRKSQYFHRLQEGLDENLINQMVKKKTGFLSIFHT